LAMKVSKLGQFGLIDLVARLIEESRDNETASWKNLVDGIGDDCAVWRAESGRVLAKVDCQVQNVHFNLDIIDWHDLGWKALAVNLSDIAAMGGRPRYALVSLGLPLQTEVEDVVSLYRGMLELARITGTAIVGGNMSGSEMVFIDVNVIGVAGNKEGSYMKRSAAEPGDRIAVTGWLGSSAAGLEMLSKKLKFEDSVSSFLKESFARPEPRLEEGLLLVKKGVECGIDISDGLLADLGHICQASRVGAVLKLERLPIRSEVQMAFGSSSLEMALAGGEDYQLLFTAKPEVMQKVQKSCQYPVTVIGQIQAAKAGEVRVLDQKGKIYHPHKSGWDHFKSR
jgi:thiamine-monophosphate kinase